MRARHIFDRTDSKHKNTPYSRRRVTTEKSIRKKIKKKKQINIENSKYKFSLKVQKVSFQIRQKGANAVFRWYSGLTNDLSCSNFMKTS